MKVLKWAGVVLAVYVGFVVAFDTLFLGMYQRRALENPDVRVEIDAAVADYVAVPVDGEEFERVAAAHPLPLA